MSDASQEHEELLAYTQSVRKKIIGKLMPNGEAPMDVKEQHVILDALTGIDKQVLTLKKIASDEGLGNKQLQAVNIIADIFNNPNTQRFNQIPLSEQPGVITEEQLVLPENLTNVNVIPGELEPLGRQEDHDSFMRRMNSNNSE